MPGSRRAVILASEPFPERPRSLHEGRRLLDRLRPRLSALLDQLIGDSVAVIDLVTRETVARIKVGKAPKRLLVVDVGRGER